MHREIPAPRCRQRARKVCRRRAPRRARARRVATSPSSDFGLVRGHAMACARRPRAEHDASASGAVGTSVVMAPRTASAPRSAQWAALRQAARPVRRVIVPLAQPRDAPPAPRSTPARRRSSVAARSAVPPRARRARRNCCVLSVAGDRTQRSGGRDDRRIAVHPVAPESRAAPPSPRPVAPTRTPMRGRTRDRALAVAPCRARHVPPTRRTGSTSPRWRADARRSLAIVPEAGRSSLRRLARCVHQLGEGRKVRAEYPCAQYGVELRRRCSSYRPAL